MLGYSTLNCFQVLRSDFCRQGMTGFIVVLCKSNGRCDPARIDELAACMYVCVM